MTPLSAVLVSWGLLSSCATALPPSHQPPPPLRAADQEALGPNAVLQIRVLDEPELTADYRVLADGTITYPYCGRVQVAGKAPSELEQHLRGCLSDFVLDPQLSVLVKERGQRITVLGSVARPGVYPLEPGLTALQAVALAGGSSEGAPASAVLTRRDDTGELRRYALSLWAITRGEESDVLLRPGDTLYISTSR